jgi:outer membrane protein
MYAVAGRALRPAVLASCVIAGGLSGQATRPGADTVALTLGESLARAVQLSTAVLLSTDSLRVSGARVLEAYGGFLPAAATGASAGFAQGDALLSSTALQATDARWHAASYQLSTALNVFNGFRDREALKAARFQRDASTFSLEQARQRVSFDVLQSFFQVVLDHRLAAVARANLALSRTRQAQLEGQVQAGTRAPPDLFRQRAQTAADESAVIDFDARAQADVVGLTRRLRLEPTRDYAVQDPQPDTTALPDSALDVRTLVAQALSRRPDLHAAQARAAAAEAAIGQATGLYLPRVVVGADFIVAGRVYDWERQNGVNLLTVDQRPLGTQLGRQGLGIYSLGVSWTLFDRFSTPLEVERARAASNQAALASDDVRLQVLGDVRQAVDDYRAALQKLRASESGVTSAQEAFDAVTGRYDAGLGTFIDVQVAQTALTQARALREDAVVNMVLRGDVLRFVTGITLTAP